MRVGVLPGVGLHRCATRLSDIVICECVVYACCLLFFLLFVVVVAVVVVVVVMVVVVIVVVWLDLWR